MNLFLKINLFIMAFSGISGAFFSSRRSRGIDSLRFFTNQSNLIIVITTFIYLVFAILNSQNILIHSQFFYFVRMQSIVAIIITFSVFNFIILPATSKRERNKDPINKPYKRSFKVSSGLVANIILHYLVPTLATLDFIIYDNHTLISWWMPLACLIYPLLYYLSSILLAQISKPFETVEGKRERFPYFFFDKEKIGWLKGGSYNSRLGVIPFFFIILFSVVGVSYGLYAILIHL